MKTKLKSKIWNLTMLALLCVSAPLRLTAAADPTAIYTAGQVQVEAIAYTETGDVRNYDTGGGAAITYWHFANLGLGIEGKTQDTGSAFFDTLGANLATRTELKPLKIGVIGRMGFDWRAEQNNDGIRGVTEFDVYAAAGVEKRFKNYNLGIEARGLRAVQSKPEERLQILLRAGTTF